MQDPYLAAPETCAEIVGIAACAALVLLGMFMFFARRMPRTFMRRNFRKVDIPNVGGLAAAGATAIAIGIEQFTRSAGEIGPTSEAFAFVVIIFALFGLIDDLFGNRGVGGFRGHFGKLLRDGTVTTGLVKAVGGLIAALAFGWLLTSVYDASSSEHGMYLVHAAEACAVGLMIALSANFANLLDVRPGRCLIVIVVFAAAAAGLGVMESKQVSVELACVVVGCALPIYLYDRAGRIMIGDTGSNSLGAGLGVIYATLLPIWVTAIAIIALAAFQIWCEKHSFSSFLESHPALRSIDRKIGIR